MNHASTTVYQTAKGYHSVLACLSNVYGHRFLMESDTEQHTIVQ